MGRVSLSAASSASARSNFFERWYIEAQKKAWEKVRESALQPRKEEQPKEPKNGRDVGLVIGRISQRTRSNVFAATVKAYPNDTKVQFVPRNREARVRGGERGKVKGFSRQSRARAIFRLRNIRAEVKWRSFITLTYPAVFPNPEQAKKHLNAFLTALRRKFPGPAYYWVAELQERGALHYHLLTDRFVPKEWLSQRWFSIVGSGDEKHLKAGTSVQRVGNSSKLSSYLVGKYLNKGTQKVFEEWVGRVWGCSRGLEAAPEVTYIQGTHQQCSRALRPMVRLLRHRKVNQHCWRWRGTSFSVYGVSPPQVERLLAAGISGV